MRPFELQEVPALSRSTVDRQEALRTDPQRLTARWPDARIMVIDHGGRTPVRREDVDSGPASLSTRKAAEFAGEPPAGASFLGEWEGVDYWMLPVDPPSESDTIELDGGWGVRQEVPVSADEAWLDLRGHGALLDDTSAGLLTTAEALRNWHRRGTFCTRCGSAVRLVQFGWISHCTGCDREEYPRTDPAVICLVHDDIGVNGANVLLARQPVWPPKRYSVLAGFVEAGESLEGCVEREVLEEVGVAVTDVRYLGSQPWPFPRSIMLGFAARTVNGAELTPADGEIEEARWFSRADVRAAIDGEHDELLLPGSTSIASVMIRSWAAAEQ
ncbi:NAD+ diphosphatase [Prauserella flava]|uniref:NAD(+) diphosphatase n=1 Tax=Prauserella sediminis TaxID=577680 RepID=A0A839XJ60_9PSEU|nr:NAD+ diphosphatase [Prauserella sediminis]MCR3722824.1 NAD+ diphosphatase [Prauserella flava]MCR3737121.1 NAD+ diphosphatase [Prauserella salsuginis]